MLKPSIWFCLFLFNFQLNAQLKDTLRQKIDYRKFPSSPSSLNETESSSQSNPELKKTRTVRSIYSRDTIRDIVNYKKLYLMRSSFRSTPVHPFSYFVGVQLNQAYRYVYKDNEWPTQSNPYWLTFNVNHKNSGYGTGFGYGFFTISQSRGMDSVDNPTASEFTKSFLRLSLDRKKTIMKRFVLDVSLDILIHKYKDINKTFISGFVNENSIYTSGFGLGPRVALSYRVFRFLLVGTESGFYYLTLKETLKEQFTGLPAKTSTKSNSSFSWNAPLTIYLTFKII